MSGRASARMSGRMSERVVCTDWCKFGFLVQTVQEAMPVEVSAIGTWW